MKKERTNVEEYKNVKAYNKAKFTNDNEDKLMVSEEMQIEALQKLKMGLSYERFYFVVDVKEMKIIYAKGLEEIGYNSETFDMVQYAKLLPSKGILQLLTIFWFKIFEFCQQERNLLKFLSPKYIVQIPIQSSNSETMLVKRVISPFQFTESGKLTQYLSEFNIIKYSFDNEPPSPRFVDFPIHLAEKLSRFLGNLSTFDILPFSPKEKQILKIYANDNSAKSTKELAELAKVTTSTLQYYNKMILANTREYLGEIYKFDSAKQVSHFLKKCFISS